MELNFGEIKLLACGHLASGGGCWREARCWLQSSMPPTAHPRILPLVLGTVISSLSDSCHLDSPVSHGKCTSQNSHDSSNFKHCPNTPAGAPRFLRPLSWMGSENTVPTTILPCFIASLFVVSLMGCEGWRGPGSGPRSEWVQRVGEGQVGTEGRENERWRSARLGNKKGRM